MNILFVNACVREHSRTRFLAERVLARLDGTVTEVNPAAETKPIVSEQFIDRRNRASETGEFSDPVYTPARQFSEADVIVIAAPYWDLSFPAVLKAYFEQINVLGLTFEYTDDGFPRGLCRAKKLIYVTTAGGPIISDEYGYGYVKALAQNFYGIPDICQVKAEMLDVIGADVNGILNKALKEFP
ncbi:MAG: NAD(P)H-dependent oxidoreductase [Eubacteriales bacterium]